ncbi:MAG: renalase [Myxococcota bacterium]|jgi:renalase
MTVKPENGDRNNSMDTPLPRPRIAVIGAGISGLCLSRALTEHGLDVVVFDKARGPGGRMSTRRSPTGHAFDHGAQFFTAHTPAFKAQVARWRDLGVVARWEGRFATVRPDGLTPEPPGRLRHVGAPRMSTLTRHLSSGLDLRTSTRIAALNREAASWTLTTTEGATHGPFTAVLSTAPAPQTAPLLAPHSPILAQRAESATMLPCFCLMLAFDTPLPVDFDAAEVHASPLRWIAQNSSKPGRLSNDCWVLHADAAWSHRHLNDEPASVQQAMLTAFWEITGNSTPVWASLHRWRYALAMTPDSGPPFLWDPALGLGAAGDWLVGGRVESAWRSGMALADAVLDGL